MSSNNKTRTHNTLFMLMSIDGKISTGIQGRDIDTDSKYITSLKEGRYQYEDLEQQTDLVSFNTGKVMAKVGWNEEKEDINKIPVEFVIVDSKPHLTELGVNNLLQHVKKLYLVTNNPNHPALKVDSLSLEVLSFEQAIDFKRLFTELKENGVERVTIQSGGTMNNELIRADLIDELSLVIAPIMVGGERTPTLQDGLSVGVIEELGLIKEFEIIDVKVLEKSFLHIRYKRREEK